jgi:hypothetical protein
MTLARKAKPVEKQSAATAVADATAEQPSRGATACQAAAADVTAWEREIDERVYRLYGLTKEEIKLVDESARQG